MKDREKQFKERIKCGIAYCEDIAVEEIKQDFKIHEEKHKQIEEMAKMIRYVLESRTDITFIPDLDKPIAEKLLKHYQPKLPENMVVLTEREHEIAMRHQYDVGFSFGYKQARKETVKEIITMIKDYYGDISIIAKIAKQYGVEIKE